MNTKKLEIKAPHTAPPTWKPEPPMTATPKETNPRNAKIKNAKSS